MHIGEICKRSVVTCGRETSALELAQMMRDRHVGDVIVVDEQEGRPTPVGIVTDRDLVVQIIAKGVKPELVRAGDMLVGDLVTADETEDVYDAIWPMRSKGIRRLPVVDAQARLLGVVTADDVTALLAAELTELARIVPRRIKLEEASRPLVAS